MTRYITHIALLLALVACGALLWSTWRNGLLKTDNAALQSQIEACTARTTDIIEHEDRSDEIDNLSDDDLRNRASQFMR